MWTETLPFREKGWKLPCFSNSCWEILPPLLLAGCRYLGIRQRFSYTL
jgi:hypothetical protein